jgi:hypothetical protein
VTEIGVVVACAECQVHWHLEVEPPKCSDPGHEHRGFEVHRHRSTVELPDGIAITAVSFDPRDPYLRERPPDYGLHLDPQWRPPWRHDHLDWPDVGVPSDTTRLLAALRSLRRRPQGGDRVELGCSVAMGVPGRR